jgi:hypothetical protein
MLLLVCRSVYSVENPYRLTRDIVIKCASETAGQLDFQFLSGKVLVGSGVTVTLENLVVRNIRWAEATAVAATAAAAALLVSLGSEHTLAIGDVLCASAAACVLPAHYRRDGSQPLS